MAAPAITPDTIVAIVTAVGGVLGGGALVAWLNRKKTKAEATGIEVSGHMEIVDRTLDWNRQLLEERDKLISRIDAIEEQFNTRLQKMEREIDELEKENGKLRERCRALEKEKEQMQNKLEDLKD